MTHSNGIKVNLQRDGRLYKLPLERNPMTFSSNKESQLWHNRFGHVNNEDLQRTLGKKIPQDEFCKVCPLGKLSTSPIAKDRKDKATEPSERVFSDVMGPFQIKGLNGFQYAVTFVCDYSKHCVVKFMKNKSEVLDKFKEYVADTKKPQILRSDNGTEYTSQAMKDFCVEKSIRQEFTVPETPQQNGVAERMNRTLVDMTRCLLIQSKLSKQYWVRAMATAVHIRNLIVTRDSPENKPPFELFWKKAPKLSHLRTFLDPKPLCKIEVINRNWMHYLSGLNSLAKRTEAQHGYLFH